MAIALGALAPAGAGCGGEGARGAGAESASASARSLASASLPAADDGAAELGRALVARPMFTRAAASRDATDFAALGKEAGARALVAAMSDASARPVALAALPFADDADLAFRPLARAAREAHGDEGAELVDALAASLEHPRALGELLDPEGVRAASADLLVIARDETRGARVRALASTLLGRLADRGFVDRSAIPAL